MAAWNAASFAFDGLLKPLTFRTNCNEAARISSSVTGGSKLNRVLMFLHTICSVVYRRVSSSRRRAATIVSWPGWRLMGSTAISSK